MNLKSILLIVSLLLSFNGFSQQTINHQGKYNQFYQYGIADAFIGGLYKGALPVKDLKLKGDFGLGAPDMLDGELTMVDGKVYQTKATGETIEPKGNFKTSFFLVTFFKADTIVYINQALDQKSVLEQISKLLTNNNAMYSIKITGKFDQVKTRAFPPVEDEPFPPLVTILDKQQFFEYQNTEGTLIGYRLPDYLNGISIAGFHFHFLSSDKRQGGHMLDFGGKNIQIEIAELKNFILETPNDIQFQNFQFKKEHNEALEKVEKGK